MVLKFDYGIDVQKFIVTRTYQSLEWYKKNGYGYKKLGFPGHLNPVKNSLNNMLKQLKKEYDTKDYKKAENHLKKYYDSIEDKLNNEVRDIFGRELAKKYTVYLTNYGVGGSYNHKTNSVYVAANSSFKPAQDIFIHELMHTIVEPYIIKYDIKHLQKERIVDLLLNNERFSFLKYRYWKNTYKGAEKSIDKLFKKYFFKDVNKFFEEVKKRN